MSAESYTHRFSGLDGSNPIAFLAALGTVRALGEADSDARMLWECFGGAWRPTVRTSLAPDQDSLVRWLSERLAGREHNGEFDLRSGQQNTTVAPEVFEGFVRKAVEHAEAGPEGRREVDFAAAFGCEATANAKGERISDTALRTMSGSGNQHFLAIMRNVISETREEHFKRTLFLPWDYADPMQSSTLRWDPADDRRYAYRWTDPGLPKTRKRGGMLGANRLAIEGLPLLPSLPAGKGVRTTGFRSNASRVEWTWPIWSVPAGLDVIRSVLAMGELQVDRPHPARLRRFGVAAVYRSRRVSSRYYRNFAMAQQI